MSPRSDAVRNTPRVPVTGRLSRFASRRPARSSSMRRSACSVLASAIASRSPASRNAAVSLRLSGSVFSTRSQSGLFCTHSVTGAGASCVQLAQDGFEYYDLAVQFRQKLDCFDENEVIDGCSTSDDSHRSGRIPCLRCVSTSCSRSSSV